MRKKAQLKIQEMSFMMLAVILLVFIVLLFYVSVSSFNVKKNFQELARHNSLSILIGFADYPEFNCVGASSCIDTDKLIGFMGEKEKYKNYWGNEIKGIVIEKVFSFSNIIKGECSMINYPNCDKYTIIPIQDNSIGDSGYIGLCREEYKNNYNFKQCDLGRITVYTDKNEK
jgi:hypothetical protein